MKTFAEKIKQLRVEKGVTQKQVGDAVGVSANAIANYELGTREPDFQILAKLCQFYDVSSDFLIGLSDFE